MKLVPVTEAKAKLTALVHDAENEDIALLRHGKPAAVLISNARYEELMEQLEDLEDAQAVAEFRRGGEPTMEAGEFFAKLNNPTQSQAG